MERMYESRDTKTFFNYFKKYTISYVTVENVRDDKNLPQINLSYFLKTYHPAFTSSDKKYAIFTAQSMCKPEIHP